MAHPLSHHHSPVALAVLAAFIAACSSSTGPTSVLNIRAHQAAWNGQKFMNYSYTYEFSAFNALANQPLRLEVRQDTVRSVVVLATGDSIDATYFPTIDALFAQALTAELDGSLTHIEFDAVLGYPTRIPYSAVPDALSSQQASALELAP